MQTHVGDSPSGKASDSDSDTGGSNPSSPTNTLTYFDYV